VIFVTEVGAVLTTLGLFFPSGEEPSALSCRWPLAVVHRALCQFCGSHGRRTGQSPGEGPSKDAHPDHGLQFKPDGSTDRMEANQLRKGDLFIVSAGEIIPADGEIIEGVATVDESAITGESAPVIREAGATEVRSQGYSGSVRLDQGSRHADPGESFLDHMIALVEGAHRRKTPNEIALTILLSALTGVFLVVIITLRPFGLYSGVSFSITVLVALLVCLIPTTIGGLLSAIGIAGIDRMVQKNVLAMSGRAVEAAGMWMCCSWIKREPSPSETARPPSLSRPRGPGRGTGRCRATGIPGRRDSGRQEHCHPGKNSMA